MSIVDRKARKAYNKVLLYNKVYITLLSVKLVWYHMVHTATIQICQNIAREI